MRTHSSAFEDLKVIEKTVLQYDCAYYICDVSSIYVFEINVKAVDVIFCSKDWEIALFLVNFYESTMISWIFMVGFYGSGVCDSLVSFCRFPRPQCLQDLVFLYILKMMRWSQAWCINILLHSWNSRCKDNGTFFRSPCFEFSACVHSLISTHPEKNTTWIFWGWKAEDWQFELMNSWGFQVFLGGALGRGHQMGHKNACFGLVLSTDPWKMVRKQINMT